MKRNKVANDIWDLLPPPPSESQRTNGILKNDQRPVSCCLDGRFARNNSRVSRKTQHFMRFAWPLSRTKGPLLRNEVRTIKDQVFLAKRFARNSCTRNVQIRTCGNTGVRSLVTRPCSGGRTVPGKRLFKENAPFILFVLMDPFA